MRKFGLLALLLLTALCTSCAKMPDTPDAPHTDECEISDGRFRVCLTSNPSTGYNWYVDVSDKSVIPSYSDTFESADKTGKMCGAGGRVTYTFDAGSDGTARITITHMRPWENTFLEKKTVTVTVKDGAVVSFTPMQTLKLE